MIVFFLRKLIHKNFRCSHYGMDSNTYLSCLIRFIINSLFDKASKITTIIYTYEFLYIYVHIRIRYNMKRALDEKIEHPKTTGIHTNVGNSYEDFVFVFFDK